MSDLYASAGSGNINHDCTNETFNKLITYEKAQF